MESAWPMAMMTSRLTPFALPARSSSFERPSGLITDLSKSKSTSAAKVIFSATGLGFSAGFGGAGGGAGLGSGLGAGAGAGTGSGLASAVGSEVAQPAAKATATNTASRFLVIRSPPVFVVLWIVLYFRKSRVCVTLEGILPQVRELFQTGEGAWQQASLGHARFTAHPDVRDVLAARGIDEVRHRVVAGRKLGSAQRHRREDGGGPREIEGGRHGVVAGRRRGPPPRPRREVGGLSRDDRAGGAVDAER